MKQSIYDVLGRTRAERACPPDDPFGALRGLWWAAERACTLIGAAVIVGQVIRWLYALADWLLIRPAMMLADWIAR